MRRIRRLTRRLLASISAATLIVVTLPQLPAAGSLPGDNGDLLVFGHVGDERGLFLVDLDPLSLAQLPIEAHDLDLYSAAWSPTGSHVAFTRYDPTTEQHGLWVYDMATEHSQLIRTAEPGHEFTDVSWSPSGREIAVGVNVLDNSGRRSEIKRLDLDGSVVGELALPSTLVWRVEWSPTRPELLVWLGWRETGNPAAARDSTCLVTIETQQADCIAEGGRWPVWSPDGEHIALGASPSSELTIVDRSGHTVRSFGEAAASVAAWSPDGRRVAYGRYLGEPEAGQYAIEVIDLETGNRHDYVTGIENLLDMRWQPRRPASGYLDVPDTHVFAADVAWLDASGLTTGCNPPLSTLFCPELSVTRGEVAAFLHRALGGLLTPAKPHTVFDDTTNSIFAADIAWLSATGITKGCNPPANNRFCPDDPITRGELAAFLVRAMGYTDDGGGDLFTDDDNSIFEHAIDLLGAAGVTRGCSPTAAAPRFCPDAHVTRGQVGAFLRRALG